MFSLWQPPGLPPNPLVMIDTSRAIFADKRAGAVGDILTVVVQENTVANKNNETKTEKSSSLSAAITSLSVSRRRHQPR